MKAIRIHSFGPTEEVLQYEDVPAPEPKAGEVLIKVEAASLNRADLGLRKGTYRISADALPIIPGREFAGTIEKLGTGVNEYRAGQRVVAYPSLGGYAEYARRQSVRNSANSRRCHFRSSGCATDHLSHRVVRSKDRR